MVRFYPIMTDKFYESTPVVERAYLVGTEIRGSRPLLSIEGSLEELALLADTAGMEVVGQNSQVLNQIDSATYIGSGKVQEIIDEAEALDAKVIIFDSELSPRHQRELEKRFSQDHKVLDRTALILDIFAQHARTHEGVLQVELAQYEYRLPRLTRQWTHLARQAGGGGSRSGNAGVGLRGPGETQLEVDRREIGRKITKLKNDLEQVRKHRKQHRTQRSRTGIPVVALVGYTNAGKSTLLQSLTGSDVYIADQLFATLDPTTRKITLPSSRTVLMTDTVGFIQKLPTTLVAAFRATLEEISEADLILHVVDATSPFALEHIEAVEDTLAELDVPRLPHILVWNKIDLYEDSMPLPDVEDYAETAQVSAKEGIGTDQLLQQIDDVLANQLQTARLLIPYSRGDITSTLFDMASVEQQEHTADGIILTVSLPSDLYKRYEEFRLD